MDPGLPVEPVERPGWTRATFGELLEVVERPAVLRPDAEYRLVTVKRNREGVVLREALRGHEVLTKTQFYVAANDFLMSKRQIIHGACGLVPPGLDGAIVSNEYAVLRPKPQLSLEYLRQLTHTPYFQRTCFHSSHGVDVEKMIFKLGNWFEYALPLPPLDEQRRIAAVLSAIDVAVERQESVVAAADHLLTSLLHEIIGARLGTSKYPTAAVADLADFSGGNGFTPRDWVPSGLPIIRIQNLNGNPNFNYYGGEPQADWIVEPGELLFAWAGSRGSSFGPCIWPGPRGVLNQHIHRLTPKPRATLEFLYWVLRFITVEIEKRAHGFKDSLVHLRKSELTDWPVRVPPLERQLEIARTLDRAAALRDAERGSALRLRATKSAASIALLSGAPA